ncbi:MAG: type II toxin-antitoxin system VapC family toxin [Bacteroidales bacterium]|jgi:predicted nucleic acid-binding protein|nr:type II toxin-antitoxin system VapC family toxin [Bacteroidales bacterium]
MKQANKNHIFIDTNILIGACANKETDQKCLNYLFSLQGKKLYISALSIAQFVSVFQKKLNNEAIKKEVRYLQSKFNILSFTENDINDSLHFKYSDIEDSIQYIVSQKFNCAYIITNNKKDYANFLPIVALLPTQVRIISKD